MGGYFTRSAIAAAVVLTATQSWADEPLKIGFVNLGTVGDFGFNYQLGEGRNALEAALGDKIQVTFTENINEGPDAERAIERLVRAGNKLIFTTSFGFMDPTITVAAKFPDVKFENFAGYKRAENVATYMGRPYEGFFVEGQIAAKLSKSGTAGFIGSFPIPEVVSSVNAFVLGAQSVNPAMQVKVIWVNSWYDPGKEADAAKVLIGHGADVLAQYTDSAAPMQIAEENKIHAFGHNSDMTKFGPNSQLTAIVHSWGGYFTERAQLVIDGKWSSTETWNGLAEGMFVMAPFRNMPEDVRQMAEDTVSGIKSGAVHPFKCPIVDQGGKTVECLGKDALSNEQILSMNWYVKGIGEGAAQ